MENKDKKIENKKKREVKRKRWTRCLAVHSELKGKKNNATLQILKLKKIGYRSKGEEEEGIRKRK